MNKSIVALVMAAFVVGCKDKYEFWYFRGGTENLQFIQEEWVKEGRPVGFRATNFMGPNNIYFDFTNTLTITNKVFHCRFAERHPALPGLLAITDDGVILWIRDRDGKVTISPEINGAEK
jgi:hypothetical protein